MTGTVGESGRPFDELLGIVREAASGRTYQRALGAVAREFGAIVRESFAGERSPAGEAWKPLRRPRPGRILDKTGTLRRRATRILLSGQRIEVQWPPYGGYHQDGTGRMPARPFAPTEPLDPVTRARLERAVDAVLAETP